MNCPCCGNEMEPGYIQCRDGVYWSRKRRAVPALPPLKHNSIRLGTPDEINPFAGGYAVEVYCCPDCKKMVIDYGKTAE